MYLASILTFCIWTNCNQKINCVKLLLMYSDMYWQIAFIIGIYSSCVVAFPS